MRVTLLGTGDATSVPAPLCDCEFCTASERRRHPAVLVETETTRLLFDVGPDLQEQLAELDVRSIDAAFLTHAHGDHAAGIPALSQTEKWDGDHLDAVDDLQPTDPDEHDPDYPLYTTTTAHDHLADRYGHLLARLDVRTVDDWEAVGVGDATVEAVTVEHHREECQTLGFRVETDGASVLYAPDVRRWHDGAPDPVDCMVCEGAALLGQPVHGPYDELRAAVDSVGAERVVLVNVNEHLQRAHTDELRDRAAAEGAELGADFATYEVGDTTD